MNAREANTMATIAFQKKTDHAAATVISSIDYDILREAEMGWFEVNIIIKTRLASLHMSFNDGIVQVIMEKVRRHYEDQGYKVACNTRGDGLITISWERVM